VAVLDAAEIASVTTVPGWITLGVTPAPPTLPTPVPQPIVMAPPSGGDDESFPDWAIALVVVGALLLILAIVLIVCYCCCKDKSGCPCDCDCDDDCCDKQDKKNRELQRNDDTRGQEFSQVGSQEDQPWNHPDEPRPGQMNRQVDGSGYQQPQYASQQAVGQEYVDPQQQAYASQQQGLAQPQQAVTPYSQQADYANGGNAYAQGYAPQGSQAGMEGSQSRGFKQDGVEIQEEFQGGDRIEGMYEDGWFGGEIVSKQENGMYTVNWDDGTHSENVPPDTLKRNPYID